MFVAGSAHCGVLPAGYRGFLCKPDEIVSGTREVNLSVLTATLRGMSTLIPMSQKEVQKVKIVRDIRAGRLAGIQSLEAANRFLATRFVPAFNRRYAVLPRADADVHRPLGARGIQSLPDVLCRLVTDPSACTATATQPVKITPAPGPIQLSVSPKTIKLGESVTVNVAFNLADTSWVYTNLYEPIFHIVGWCQSGNSHCTFNWTPTVSGTLTIDSYGMPLCDKLSSSHTTATVVVNQ